MKMTESFAAFQQKLSPKKKSNTESGKKTERTEKQRFKKRNK